MSSAAALLPKTAAAAATAAVLDTSSKVTSSSSGSGTSTRNKHPAPSTSTGNKQQSKVRKYPKDTTTTTNQNAVTPESGFSGSNSPVPVGNVPTTASDCSNPTTNWQFMTRTIAHYERKEQIGEGTYGQVYTAICKDSGETVAMKKMRLHHSGYWGMPLQMVREIKILRRLKHPNLLKLIEVVTSKGVEHLDPEDPPSKSIKENNDNENNELYNDRTADVREGYKGNLFLVLEYVPHDLTGLMDISYPFTPVQIKCMFRQLLQALQYMHSNKYVHRDIKSSNILLTSSFQLKLADFGLARSIEIPLLDQLENNGNEENLLDLTNKVVTLWYRPPEILLGTVHYGYAIDVWSAACILAELCLGKPLFTGKTEVEQLRLIADLLGTPSPETFTYLQSLKKRQLSGSGSGSSGNGGSTFVSSSTNPNSASASLMMKAIHDMEVTCTNLRPSKLREKYANKSISSSSSSSTNSPSTSTTNTNNGMPDSAINLLEKLFEWDPRKRLSAAHALEHRYFWTQPVAPTNPADLGTLQVAASGHFHEFQTKQKRRQAKAVAEEAKQDALFHGACQEEALAKFDSVYRSLMKQVAQEGFSVNCTIAAVSSTSTNNTSVGKALPTTKVDVSAKKDDGNNDEKVNNSSTRRSRSSSSGRRVERGSRRGNTTIAGENSERASKDEQRDRSKDEHRDRNKEERDREKNRKRREHRKRRDESERSSSKRRSERERKDRDRKGSSPGGAKDENSLNNESDVSTSRRRRSEIDDDDEKRKRNRRGDKVLGKTEGGGEDDEAKDRRPSSNGSHKESKRRRKERSGSADDRSGSDGNDSSSGDDENHDKDTERRSSTNNKRGRRSRRHRSSKDKERSGGESRRPGDDSKDRPRERSRSRDRDRDRGNDYRRGGSLVPKGDNDRNDGNRNRDLMPPPGEYGNSNRGFYDEWDIHYRGGFGGGRPGDMLPPPGPFGPPPPGPFAGPPLPFGGGGGPPPPGFRDGPMGPPHRWDHRREGGSAPVGGGIDGRGSGNGGGGGGGGQPRRDNRDGPPRREGAMDHYGPPPSHRDGPPHPGAVDHYGPPRWDGPPHGGDLGGPPGGHWDRDGRNPGRRDGHPLPGNDHSHPRRDHDGPPRNGDDGNGAPRRDRDGPHHGNSGSDRDKNNGPQRQDHHGPSSGSGRGPDRKGGGDGSRRGRSGDDDRNRNKKDSSRRKK